MANEIPEFIPESDQPLSVDLYRHYLENGGDEPLDADDWMHSEQALLRRRSNLRDFGLSSTVAESEPR